MSRHAAVDKIARPFMPTVTAAMQAK